MDKVYIVQFDWATPDADGIDIFVYGKHDDAYNKFKQLICEERDPEMSWVGNIEFDADGYPKDDGYEFEFKDADSYGSQAHWHIRDKNDWFMHSFIDLFVKEIL